MSFSITDEVVNFLVEDRWPPQDVREKALEHITDGLAVMLAGSRTDCSHKLFEYLKEKGGGGISTAIGFDTKLNPPDAALINGTSGHADDYDDTQLSTAPDRIYGLLTHPTVPVLASTLALGESVGSSGREFLKAFITGFEIECKLAETIKPEHYQRGFHSTGTMGTFGSLASSIDLLNLGEEEIRYSLGIAASLSSGIRANFGTMTKPLHAGMASSNGIIACMLGKRGFTSDKSILDGRWGYMEILGGGADPEMMEGKLGNPYTLIYPGATIKMYPCGSLAQPSMDALLEMVEEEDLSVDMVQEIKIRAGSNILDPLRYEDPVDKLQAKFSLQFGLATILLRRKAGLREYTDEWVNNPKLRETMKKVRTIHDEELERRGAEKMRSIIEVELKDGRTIRKIADTARGSPEKPLRGGELEGKFRDCASFVLDEDEIRELLGMINNLEGLSDISDLTTMIG
jgi:2-methylcitrate dehydratase PrpD